MLSSWLRAIRIRFLSASIIAVSAGLSLAYWKTGEIDPLHAALTYVGVVLLHASVDLLNEYWDHKRGIDLATTRTRFSGGTGVLPENLLAPRTVYAVGMICLVMGAAIGAYFVAIRGVAIALILGFAVAAIYFYSTSIVNAGLGELFVAIKGTMIVLGTFYVQTVFVDSSAVPVGVVIGLLSANVLFITSFPDYEADRGKGRRTLVILLGKTRSVSLFPIFFVAVYLIIVAGVLFGFTKVYSLASLGSIPFAVRAVTMLRRSGDSPQGLVPAMSATVTYSRITGIVLAISLLF